MSPEEFRRHGHAIVDWIADYRARIAERPVASQVEPGSVRAHLAASPPEAGESFDRIIRDLDEVLLPGLTHWVHPRFFGYFPSNGELSSVLGDFLSTGLGTLGLTWQSSPALTELEETAVDWLRQMVGLSARWRGVIQDTASAGTLVALICARERATTYARDRGGLQSQPHPLRVYLTAHAHSSVRKAALLAGFGEDNLHIVEHDEAYAMRASDLRRAIERDLASGMVPCAVVATTGTTATTAFDPIATIAPIAAAHGMWLHVDAAMAGPAMILPECRTLWHGVEGADSIVMNPHKWLGAAFDCSVSYVRDVSHLVRVMSVTASYLQSATDAQVTSFRDWGIPLGRRFRALKLWFLIREQGVEALRARLRRDIANARWLETQVRSAPGWHVLAPVALQTVVLWHDPQDAAGGDGSLDRLNRHTLDWVARVNRSGEAFMTPADVDGRWVVRVSIGALTTTRDDVARAWTVMRHEAERFPDPSSSRILGGI